MRFFILSLLALLLLEGRSFSAECWTSGVTKESGWYDANKLRTRSNTNEDSNLCWAMSCSNIINWWQDRLPSGHIEGIPADSFTPEKENHGNNGSYVSGEFRKNFIDAGNWQANGFSWWLGGDARDLGKLRTPGTPSGGYYTSLLQSGAYTLDGKDSLIRKWEGTSITSENIVGTITSALNDGYGLSITITPPGQNGSAGSSSSHALTLWGIEYEGDTLTKIFYTDSDDARAFYPEYDKAQLKTANAKIINDGLGSYIGLSDATAYSYFGALSTTMENPDANYDNYYLRELTGLRMIDSIPEPAATALGMLGLMGMLCRRRKES